MINERIKEFLFSDVRKILKATSGKNPDLSKVIVWLEEFNPQNKVVVLGLALGTATGCSPFCGCAANQITEVIERMMKHQFPEINKVVGFAKVPTPNILEEWNS